MKKALVILVAAMALGMSGVASAVVLQRTIFLSPGHCTKVHHKRVCAKKVRPRTTTVNLTNTVTNTVTDTTTSTVVQTTTVYPAAAGTTVSGTGTLGLNPFTLNEGTDIAWSYTPADQYDSFYLSCDGNNNVTFVQSGAGQTSGTSYMPADSYTCTVITNGSWSITF